MVIFVLVKSHRTIVWRMSDRNFTVHNYTSLQLKKRLLPEKKAVFPLSTSYNASTHQTLFKEGFCISTKLTVADLSMHKFAAKMVENTYFSQKNQAVKFKDKIYKHINLTFNVKTYFLTILSLTWYITWYNSNSNYSVQNDFSNRSLPDNVEQERLETISVIRVLWFREGARPPSDPGFSYGTGPYSYKPKSPGMVRKSSPSGDAYSPKSPGLRRKGSYTQAYPPKSPGSSRKRMSASPVRTRRASGSPVRKEPPSSPVLVRREPFSGFHHNPTTTSAP